MTTTSEVQEILVKAQPLTEEAFAPYGRVVHTERGRLALQDREGDFTANVAVLRPASDTVRSLNRHMDHTQLFVPLNGARTLVVVAPPDVPTAGFDPARIAAFIADGTYAYTFEPGTWHIEPKALDLTNNQVINVQTDVYQKHTEVVRFGELGIQVRLDLSL